MNSKRSLSVDQSHLPSTKQIKLEHPEEFSNTVKRRLASSTRTGQACDRCKVRKIRCDGLPGGCSPCLQNNTECFTTDRITGRATSRGYTEDLEQQIRDLQARNKELEERLREINVLRYQNEYQQDSSLMQSMSPAMWDPKDVPFRSQPQLCKKGMIRTPEQKSAINLVTEMDRVSSFPDSNSTLSSLKGTVLSIMGMKIDIADFKSKDFDEPYSKNGSKFCFYNKSRQSFLKSFFNLDCSSQKIGMPSKSEALAIADWYFKAIHPYLPLLHRPSLNLLLYKIYDDSSFGPTLAQSFIIHMIFSITLFRYAAQNADDSHSAEKLNHFSNLHYHHCLSLVGQLLASQTFEDCQALTLMCYHMRNFPKPGASWIMINATFTLALELGLHRSPNKVLKDSSFSVLDIEMRKRVFWVLLGFHVDLSGKLAQPIRLRSEDFDCEIPEYINDEALENGIDTPSHDCEHSIGIEAMKLVPLYMELYSVIYAVRRKKESYVLTIKNLEARLQSWKESLPIKLSETQEGVGFRLYTQMLQLEFRLLLRHPSAWMSDTDPAFNEESLRICVESSREMQAVVRQIQKINLLDTTWCNAVVYVLAITTTLYAHWEKRGESTQAELAALKEEMDVWLDIMGDVGKLLGSGDRLREAIRKVCDSTLSLMARSLDKNTRSTSCKAERCHKSPPSPCFRLNPPAIGHQSPNSSHSFEIKPTPSENTQTSVVCAQNLICQNFEPHSTSYQSSAWAENPSLTILAYAPQDHIQNYASHAAATESNQCPLLIAFSSQTCPKEFSSDTPDWRGSRPEAFTSMAWSHWASTASEKYEPPACYTTNDPIQISDQDLSNGKNIFEGNANKEINSSNNQDMNFNISNLGFSNIEPYRSGGMNNNELILNTF